MSYLLDTSILVRLANHSDPRYTVADAAVAKLFLANETLHITPQVLIEFRSVATRPKAANGLGRTAPQAAAKAAIFESSFALLADTAGIFPAWKALVAALAVIGKQVHDARLVAVCQVHGVTHLLTFNTNHFTTLASGMPGLVIVDAATV